MNTIDERVAFLEGKVEEHSRGFSELRDSVRDLDRRVSALDEKMDRRFDALDQRMSALEERFDTRITRLDDKVSRQFLWTLGVQVAVLIAVIGALAGV